jgi:hypothetical protein
MVVGWFWSTFRAPAALCSFSAFASGVAAAGVAAVGAVFVVTSGAGLELENLPFLSGKLERVARISPSQHVSGANESFELPFGLHKVLMPVILEVHMNFFTFLTQFLWNFSENAPVNGDLKPNQPHTNPRRMLSKNSLFAGSSYRLKSPSSTE